MTEQERQQQRMVALFGERIAHYDLPQLKALWRTLNRESVNGKITFGDYATDLAILHYLNNRIKSLEQAAQGRTLPPDEQQEADAAALARENNVSISVARAYMRRHAKPAPPEEASPPPYDKRAELDAHYQNVLRNTEGSA